jgi:hypothetical protein
MATLLAICDELRQIDDLIAQHDGEISDPEIAGFIDEWLSEANQSLDRKADDYAALVQEMTLRSQARAEEAKRLRVLAEIDERAAQHLKDRLRWAMEQRGIKRIDTDRYRITVAGNGGKVPMELDESRVPPDYTIQPPPVPDKERIRADLESGLSLPFARLGERGTHLRIK